MTSPSTAQTGLLFREVTVRGQVRKYAVLVPRGYTPATPTPTIVFLNGSGECGTDGSKQAVVGLGSAALLAPERWPFIIIFPQKPSSADLWVDHDDLVMATLDATRREFAVDDTRLYLTGLSQGGRGTWEIAARHPRLFAAIVPVCGFGDPEPLGPALKDMPVWAFHGEKDNVVPAAKTRAIIDAISKAGGQPTATYFKDADHNAWDPAYRGQKIPEWFLSFQRRD